MKNLKVLFTVLCVACATAVWGETTYKLQAVSSVSAGDKCVFVQDSHAAIGSVSSSALQTTENYKTTGLSGTENYVWVIETATNGYYIKNANLSSNPYLNNSSKTNISMGSKSSIWTITFTNEVALIQNSSNSDRFLGYTTASSYVYKAYATTNMTSYPHAITVYKLIEESGSTETTPSITQHPEDATYDQGAKAAALTITASGNPTPTYQWYSNTSDNNSNGTVISGAKEASYTPSTAKAGTFYYYCVATNKKGSATSDVATIKVNAAQTYTVLWSLGGDVYTAGDPTTSVKSGEKVSTLPTAPAGDAIGSCANTFMGWSTHNLGSETGQGDPGDLFTTIEGSPVITKNTIFYAVFATKEKGN